MTGISRVPGNRGARRVDAGRPGRGMEHLVTTSIRGTARRPAPVAVAPVTVPIAA